MNSVDCTMIGESDVRQRHGGGGSVDRLPPPMARAPSTNSSVLDRSAPAPRTRRIEDRREAERPIAIIALVSDGPSTAAKRDRQDQEGAGEQRLGDARDHQHRSSRHTSRRSGRSARRPPARSATEMMPASSEACAPIDQPRDLVAPELVGAEPVELGGRLADGEEIGLQAGRRAAAAAPAAPSATKASTITPPIRAERLRSSLRNSTPGRGRKESSRRCVRERVRR